MPEERRHVLSSLEDEGGSLVRVPAAAAVRWGERLGSGTGGRDWGRYASAAAAGAPLIGRSREVEVVVPKDCRCD
jgi:hypothetical protein